MHMGSMFSEDAPQNPFELPEPMTAEERKAAKDQAFRMALNAMKSLAGG